MALCDEPDRLLLQLKIENYKRSRETLPSPQREWCNQLIQAAEEDLRRLTARDDASGRTATGDWTR